PGLCRSQARTRGTQGAGSRTRRAGGRSRQSTARIEPGPQRAAGGHARGGVLMHRRFANFSTMAALLVGVLLPLAPVGAQLGSYNPEPGPRATVAIRNARIFPVSGPVIENGTIVIADGRIQALGTNVQVPAGAEVIDASGLSVYPGMMESASTMGLSEIEQGANATREIGRASCRERVQLSRVR